MSENPITVVMPVHNGEPFIGPAIKSVLSQTFKQFELWVLENGSDDRTIEIVESFTDPRVKLFVLGPVGVVGALQYGLEHARTKWLARMDADDLMFHERLERQMRFIEENPNLTFVTTAYGLLTPFQHIVEPVLNPVSEEITKRSLVGSRFFADASIVFDRQAALDAGGADQEFSCMDGVTLMFRLLTVGKGWAIPEHLYLYRLRPNSLSRGKSECRGNRAEIVRRVHLKYAPELHDGRCPKRPPQSFWGHIARLELLAGHAEAVCHAARLMKEEGSFESEANKMTVRSWLGEAMGSYYSWRNRNTYRHRVDWEQLFGPLLGPPEIIQQAGDEIAERVAPIEILSEARRRFSANW